MSADDQRAFGHDCAHEDIRAQMDPCVSIEDARRRIASMYAGDNVSAEDIEACAQGYLAGWASALRGAKPAAFAAWLRARGDAVVNDDPAAAETLYLAAEQVPAGLSAPAWAALGEATDERDAAQLAMVEALESHTAQLRGARATIAELLRADEGAKAAREERWSKYLADVERLTAERDAAKAIVNGRGTAPTDAEIAAHAHPVRSPIGAWLVTANDGCRQLVHLFRPFDADSRSEDWEMLRRRMGPFKFPIARWVPIDAEGRPCAWPVVEGERCE